MSSSAPSLFELCVSLLFASTVASQGLVGLEGVSAG